MGIERCTDYLVYVYGHSGPVEQADSRAEDVAAPDGLPGCSTDHLTVERPPLRLRFRHGLRSTMLISSDPTFDVFRSPPARRRDAICIFTNELGAGLFPMAEALLRRLRRGRAQACRRVRAGALLSSNYEAPLGGCLDGRSGLAGA